MDMQELDTLAELERLATAKPWFVNHLDDDLCQGAVAVTTIAPTGHIASMHSGNWPSQAVVAACLIQSPPYAVPADDRFEENARLISAVRNALPDLLRLARLGLQQNN
ncbi:hypothetical protein [Novosphingobium sp.]|uniref:hypothetical protein n=1 Tax=Novosphingobium sp. TaxID=1874826 RepID=UPI002636AEB9|nr:hypothetical protein [Novosphingobium sp.]